jgi:hypothetical protein
MAKMGANQAIQGAKQGHCPQGVSKRPVKGFNVSCPTTEKQFATIQLI